MTDLFDWSPYMREPFRQWHEANPQVWRLFQRFALQAIAAGRTTLSASLIYERIRWETYVETRGDEYKLNNNYRADYARLFHTLYPEHDGIFRTRELRAKGGSHYGAAL